VVSFYSFVNYHISIILERFFINFYFKSLSYFCEKIFYYVYYLQELIHNQIIDLFNNFFFHLNIIIEMYQLIFLFFFSLSSRLSLSLFSYLQPNIFYKDLKYLSHVNLTNYFLSSNLRYFLRDQNYYNRCEISLFY
jgi:hypothetical protein